MLLTSLWSINEKISSIESLIEEKSKPYERMIALLCTIPGLKRIALFCIPNSLQSRPVGVIIKQ
jgi:hypothetical protein